MEMGSKGNVFYDNALSKCSPIPQASNLQVEYYDYSKTHGSSHFFYLLFRSIIESFLMEDTLESSHMRPYHHAKQPRHALQD